MAEAAAARGAKKMGGARTWQPDTASGSSINLNTGGVVSVVWGEGGRTVILLAHFVSSLPNPLASAQTLSPSTQLSAVVVVVVVLAVTVVVAVVAVVVGNILR